MNSIFTKFFIIILCCATMILYSMENPNNHWAISVECSDQKTMHQVSRSLLMDNSTTLKHMLEDVQPTETIKIPYLNSEEFNDWYKFIQNPDTLPYMYPDKVPEETLLPSLINIIKATHYLGDDNDTLKNVLYRKQYSSALVTKLKENPAYLSADLERIIRKDILCTFYSILPPILNPHQTKIPSYITSIKDILHYIHSTLVPTPKALSTTIPISNIQTKTTENIYSAYKLRSVPSLEEYFLPFKNKQMAQELYRSYNTENLAIVLKKNKSKLWEYPSFLLDKLVWSSDDKYLAIPIEKERQPHGLYLYDLSNINWNTQEPKKIIEGDIRADAILPLTIDQKQFFMIASNYDTYDISLILLLHLTNNQPYYTLFCEIYEKIHSLALNNDNKILVASAQNNVYHIDLKDLDNLYLEYLDNVRNLPLKDLLTLHIKPKDQDAVAAAKKIYDEKKSEQVAQNKRKFINTWFKKINLGFGGFTSSCALGYVLYQSVKNFFT